MVPSIAKLLRLASFVICTIVILSFGAFALEQTRTASNRQQEQITGQPTNSSAPASTSAGTEHAARRAHKGSMHQTLDEASADLTSPFADVLAGSGSEWAIRGAKLLLALALYGFGLGYLARALRVRV